MATKNVTTKAKKPKTRARVGRPTIFTKVLAQSICAQLVDCKSVRTICAAEDMPSLTTMYRWLDENTEFRDQYRVARDIQADTYAAETVEISDDDSRDWEMIRSPEGVVTGIKVDGEHVQRSKLRIDARKWYASKLAPKKYGERTDVNVSGQLSLEQLVLESMAPKEKVE